MLKKKERKYKGSRKGGRQSELRVWRVAFMEKNSDLLDKV